MKKYYDKNNQTIYNCDNLELLKSLESNSINLIYCDILYNTGKQFDYYNDNLGSPTEAVEWYRPRIIEMKRVLKPNGSIFLHCNWRLDSYMRVLMDEIFGGDHFRNRIYRKHSNERGSYLNFDSQIDVILYYVKNKVDFIFNEEKTNDKKIYPIFENGYMKDRSDTLIFGKRKINFKKINMHYLLPKEIIYKMYDNNEIIFIDDLPYRVTCSKALGNIWVSDETLDDYSRNVKNELYDTPKPQEIVKRIITTCSNEGDTVADFFLGGGTTAIVAKKLKRKGIYCDINKNACDVAIKKLEEIK